MKRTRRRLLLGLAALLAAMGFVTWLGWKPLRPDVGFGTVTTSPGLGTDRGLAAGTVRGVEVLIPDADENAPPVPVPPSTGSQSEESGTLTLTILHADGIPAAGATVLTARGSDVLAVTRIDEAGVARLDAADGEIDVWVGGATPAPIREHLERGNGLHRIVLPPGEVLSGQVLVDGRVPDEPVGLALDGPLEVSSTAPRPVASALEWLTIFWRNKTGQTTTTSGYFEFSNLPQDWRGTIDFPFDYRLEEDDWGTFGVERPGRGLLIRLARRTAVVGRVVDVHGQPVPGCDLGYYVEGSDGSSSGMDTQVDGEARFTIPLREVPPAFVDLSLNVPGGGGHKKLHLQDREWGRGVDLGDVVLDSTHTVAFVVHAPLGEPVPGAIAWVEDLNHARSKPTNDLGEGWLQNVADAEPAMSVTALGFDQADVPLSPDSSDPVPVVLTRFPSLDVRLVTREGNAASGLTLLVEGEAGLYSGSRRWVPDDVQLELGAASQGASEEHPDGGGRAQIVVGRDGRCTIARPRAGAAVEIGVVDTYGLTVRQPELVVIADHGTQTLRWTVDGEPQTVRAHVIDSTGAAVSSATTALLAPECSRGTWGGRPTNEAGMVEFRDVYADRVSLQVRHDGFGSVFRTGELVPSNGAAIDVVLGDAHSLDIDVVTVDGRPLDVKRVDVLDFGAPIEAEHVATGTYRAEQLTVGSTHVAAWIGGRAYTVAASVPGPTVRVVVPDLGSVEVHLDHLGSPGPWPAVTLVEVGGDTWSIGDAVTAEHLSGGAPIVFTHVRPGNYEVHLTVGGDYRHRTEWSQPMPVTVTAGSVASCVMHQ